MSGRDHIPTINDAIECVDKVYTISKTPREVRTMLASAYNTMHNEFTSHDFSDYGRSSTRREYLSEKIVIPYMKALLLLGDLYSTDDDDMKWLLAEMFVLAGTATKMGRRRYELDNLPGGSYKLVSNNFIGAKFEGPNALINKFTKLGKAGGMWTILLPEEEVKIIADTNPVDIVNSIGEMLHYARSVSFSIKLDNHQLNILKSFFRTEV
jgi:hypothetical protein